MTSSECKLCSLFKRPVGFNFGDTLLLGDRKPADGMWVKAEEASNSRTLKKQGRGVALELSWAGPGQPYPTTATDLEPRAVEVARQPKSEHRLLSYSPSPEPSLHACQTGATSAGCSDRPRELR